MMEDYPDYMTTAYPVCTCSCHEHGEEFSWWCPRHGLVFRGGKEPDELLAE